MLTVGSPRELLFTNGLIHSHTTSWPRVTSNSPPLVPSHTSTLPDSSREAPEMWPLKNWFDGAPRKVHTISPLTGSTSITRELSGPLSKICRLPPATQVGLCCPWVWSNLKLSLPLSPSITQTRLQLR